MLSNQFYSNRQTSQGSTNETALKFEVVPIVDHLVGDKLGQWIPEKSLIDDSIEVIRSVTLFLSGAWLQRISKGFREKYR